jgi:hypothetical protein
MRLFLVESGQAYDDTQGAHNSSKRRAVCRLLTSITCFYSLITYGPSESEFFVYHYTRTGAPHCRTKRQEALRATRTLSVSSVLSPVLTYGITLCLASLSNRIADTQAQELASNQSVYAICWGQTHPRDQKRSKY